MDKELLKLKKERKQRKRIEQLSNNYGQTKDKKINVAKYIFKFLLVVVITLITMITLKTNDKLKTEFYKYVYNTNFSFASINKTYQKYFGSPIPFQELLKKPVATVFNEKLTYSEANLYKDGAKLKVKDKYLVPILESGMVVFIGDKPDYGKVVIVQGVNGVDTWYGNMENVNVKLYDYVSKGSLLGETKNDTLYLVFQKEGKNLNYKDYIK